MNLRVVLNDAVTNVGGEGVALTVFLSQTDAILDIAGAKLLPDKKIERVFWVKNQSLKAGDRLTIDFVDASASSIDPPIESIVTDRGGMSQA